MRLNWKLVIVLLIAVAFLQSSLSSSVEQSKNQEIKITGSFLSEYESFGEESPQFCSAGSSLPPLLPSL